MNNDGPRMFLGCLILIVGSFFVFILWLSPGWSESYDEQYTTVTYIAITVLIPLILLIGVGLLMSGNSDTQSLRLNQKDSDKDIMNETDIKYIRLAIEVAQQARDKGN